MSGQNMGMVPSAPRNDATPAHYAAMVEELVQSDLAGRSHGAQTLIRPQIHNVSTECHNNNNGIGPSTGMITGTDHLPVRARSKRRREAAVSMNQRSSSKRTRTISPRRERAERARPETADNPGQQGGTEAATSTSTAPTCSSTVLRGRAPLLVADRPMQQRTDSRKRGREAPDPTDDQTSTLRTAQSEVEASAPKRTRTVSPERAMTAAAGESQSRTSAAWSQSDSDEEDGHGDMAMGQFGQKWIC